MRSARLVPLGRLLLVVGLASCAKAPERIEPMKTAAASSSPSSPSAAPVAASATVPDVTRTPAPARIVAIGDLHGDLAATRSALRLAGAIDVKDRWIGGSLMVVQTGDQLDRGDDERAILDLLDRLGSEARAAGGAVVTLVGNHEVMNVALDFRYVTPHGFVDFDDAGVTMAPNPPDMPREQRARAVAFSPGGSIAQQLAKHPMIAVIGDTVFVHGGVLPKHVRYGIDRMNAEVRAWMNGEAPAAPAIVTAEDGPIWTRLYSAAPGESDCALLRETLAMIPAKRMVVGHTVQRGGISSACGEQVWRIDVGLSHVYGGTPEVLEIAGDRVRPITAAK